jgi:hypothetical protein
VTNHLAALSADRAVRDAAHANFRASLEQVRADLAAKGVGGRIADEAERKAHAALDTGLEIAAEHKGVVAGTVAALLLWIFRTPLFEAIGRRFGDEDDRDEHDDELERRADQAARET